LSRVRRGYVESPLGQIHYRAAGSTGPALALFHESPLSSQIFERCLPLLGDRLRAFAFDTPGYGLSDPPENALEIPGYADLMLKALDQLSLARFAVAGVHTGASIAVEIAVQADPGRVTHAVLSGVPLFTDEERAEFLASWAPEKHAEPDGSHLKWAWDRYQRIWGDDSPPELLNLGAVHIAANLLHYNSAYNAAFRYDPGPALQRLACPVYLLNPAHDLIVYTDERVMRLVRHARMTHVPAMRGQLPWRAPELYAREVIDFVMADQGEPESRRGS
jgi:haloalkane dehalogenase